MLSHLIGDPYVDTPHSCRYSLYLQMPMYCRHGYPDVCEGSLLGGVPTEGIVSGRTQVLRGAGGRIRELGKVRCRLEHDLGCTASGDHGSQPRRCVETNTADVVKHHHSSPNTALPPPVQCASKVKLPIRDVNRDYSVQGAGEKSHNPYSHTQVLHRETSLCAGMYVQYCEKNHNNIVVLHLDLIDPELTPVCLNMRINGIVAPEYHIKPIILVRNIALVNPFVYYRFPSSILQYYNMPNMRGDAVMSVYHQLGRQCGRGLRFNISVRTSNSPAGSLIGANQRYRRTSLRPLIRVKYYVNQMHTCWDIRRWWCHDGTFCSTAKWFGTYKRCAKITYLKHSVAEERSHSNSELSRTYSPSAGVWANPWRAVHQNDIVVQFELIVMFITKCNSNPCIEFRTFQCAHTLYEYARCSGCPQDTGTTEARYRANYTRMPGCGRWNSCHSLIWATHLEGWWSLGDTGSFMTMGRVRADLSARNRVKYEGGRLSFVGHIEQVQVTQALKGGVSEAITMYKETINLWSFGLGIFLYKANGARKHWLRGYHIARTWRTYGKTPYCLFTDGDKFKVIKGALTMICDAQCVGELWVPSTGSVWSASTGPGASPKPVAQHEGAIEYCMTRYEIVTFVPITDFGETHIFQYQYTPSEWFDPPRLSCYNGDVKTRDRTVVIYTAGHGRRTHGDTSRRSDSLKDVIVMKIRILWSDVGRGRASHLVRARVKYSCISSQICSMSNQTRRDGTVRHIYVGVRDPIFDGILMHMVFENRDNARDKRLKWSDVSVIDDTYTRYVSNTDFTHNHYLKAISYDYCMHMMNARESVVRVNHPLSCDSKTCFIYCIQTRFNLACLGEYGLPSPMLGASYLLGGQRWICEIRFHAIMQNRDCVSNRDSPSCPGMCTPMGSKPVRVDQFSAWPVFLADIKGHTYSYGTLIPINSWSGAYATLGTRGDPCMAPLITAVIDRPVCSECTTLLRDLSLKCYFTHPSKSLNKSMRLRWPAAKREYICVTKVKKCFVWLFGISYTPRMGFKWSERAPIYIETYFGNPCLNGEHSFTERWRVCFCTSSCKILYYEGIRLLNSLCNQTACRITTLLS